MLRIIIMVRLVALVLAVATMIVTLIIVWVVNVAAPTLPFMDVHPVIQTVAVVHVKQTITCTCTVIAAPPDRVAALNVIMDFPVPLDQLTFLSADTVLVLVVTVAVIVHLGLVCRKYVLVQKIITMKTTNALHVVLV